MSTASSHIRPSNPAVTYAPGPSAAEQIAEAIGCILTGRPLPVYLQPQPVAIERPASVSEGIARILRGS